MSHQKSVVLMTVVTHFLLIIKILCDIEKILSSPDASEEYWLDIEKNFFKEFPEKLPEELKKFLETW